MGKNHIRVQLTGGGILGGGTLLLGTSISEYFLGFGWDDRWPPSCALTTLDSFRCTGFGGGTGFMLGCGTW